MAKTKIYWGRIIAIALICTVVDIILHGLGPKADYQAIQMPTYEVMPKPLNDKEWVAKSFLPLLALTFVLTFGFLATIFSLIQEKLPGSRLAKGFRYGISFWVLWALGILEWHYVYKSSWAYDLYNTALLDGGFMLVVSLLAARFLAVPASPALKPVGTKASLLVIPIVALLFIVGRYFSIFVFDLVTAHHVKPVETFFCLLAVGIWIGIIYRLLESGLAGFPPWKRALWFGVLIFGTNWWFFAQFEPLLVNISLRDPILRAGIDILMVVVGIFVFESFIRKGSLSGQVAS